MQAADVVLTVLFFVHNVNQSDNAKRAEIIRLATDVVLTVVLFRHIEKRRC